jgi:hypothetical protein
MNARPLRQVNVVATAVRIAGGPQKVARSLSVSRSQVYRWIKAGTMAHAIYIHVAKLANLTGIDAQFLGGNLPIPGFKQPRRLRARHPNPSADLESENGRTPFVRAAGGDHGDVPKRTGIGGPKGTLVISV